MPDTELPKRPAVHATPPPDRRHWLGRLWRPDIRDTNFRFAAVRAQLHPAPHPTERHYRHWNLRQTTDQGPTPRCVAFSAITVLLAGPVTNKMAPDKADELAAQVYGMALDRDEWEGNDPCCGTSVRAGQKAMVELGYCSGYAWGYTVKEAADMVRGYGPVIFGTVWPDSMFDPRPHKGEAWLWADDDSQLSNPHAAGHAYAVTGVNARGVCPDGSKGWFDVANSWGPDWGNGGRARLPFTQAEKLLPLGGEVCLPVEVKLKAKA